MLSYKRLGNATNVNTYAKGQSVFYEICDSDCILTINQPTSEKWSMAHLMKKDLMD